MTARSWRIWGCSLALALAGCSGLTLGPRVETRVVVIRAGTAVEILENHTLHARVLNAETTFQQDVGGWIAMHPDHWEALKREVQRLRQQLGEQ